MLEQSNMKIVKNIRDLYSGCMPRYKLLENEVNQILKPLVENEGWFFISRVKGLESFALKIETGRVSSPESMEDFFGCTVVVPTLGHIEQAELLILNNYDLKYRRPENDVTTHKAPSNFTFDDLRVYVERRPLISGRDPELVGMLFEVQIKTVLQHAWTVATHDLIYKSNTVNWPLERIAFQVKAMLEHAEVAISEANRLADAPAVAKRDKNTIGMLTLIEQIKRIWSAERLPTDVKRLADTIHALLQACDLMPEDFQDLIMNEKLRIGVLPTDLSPYAMTVQALANKDGLDLSHKISRRHIRTKLVIHSGMDLPKWMRIAQPKIVDLG
jgi:ppGpp synthetase/RelA/SpoT-type nucleotidyltranferase